MSIDSKDINYAIKTVTRFENNIDIDKLKIIKNSRNHPKLNEWLFQLSKNKKQKIYDIASDKRMNPIEIQALFHPKDDSIQIINPETNEIKIEVTSDETKAENIKQVKMYQIWAIDKRRNQFYSTLTGLAPVKIFFNTFDGSAQYEIPLFIIASD